ncbi:MAG TPA: phosphoglucomutase (alpha-D-glucose-1,6-bisphosphate-dependent) [Candidatus Limnocylindrales bacterium]|nr:phosphoglucomutase (alpha-D-glucose-1,6-bisphosphate-dependent) [Candidatus Limnocylindrales bacterium]
MSRAAGSAPSTPDRLDVDALVGAYHDLEPDPSVAAQRVAFGTSGHRGSAFDRAFNEAHILAISEAIWRHRQARGYSGPLFVGRDTHALSEPAFETALRVLVAHGVDVRVDAANGFTPTPAVSHAILLVNGARTTGPGLADGIVITPSHNPPEDGGIKYDPPTGGPADTDVTRAIQDEANGLLEAGLAGVPVVSLAEARAAARPYDFAGSYVRDLASVVDLEAVRLSGLRLGVDPMGGASLAYWALIGEHYGLDLTVTNDRLDPRFAFMPPDWDGRIRTDPSSPQAMARLVELRDRFDLALANDADADRHGIVTPAGLMNPNHVLAAAIAYLFGGAREWGSEIGVGKTIVSSSIIDRVVADLRRRLVEVPVGFRWFVPGLLDGQLGFGGEESAGASFLRRDGRVWTTDKDGIVACLLAAELTAKTGRDPAALYGGLTERLGDPCYRRIDAPADADRKAALARLSADDVRVAELAGERVVRILTTAPGNGAPIGGIKVETDDGWFAARPSGTEDVYKLYAESFVDEAHLDRIVTEARSIVETAIS